MDEKDKNPKEEVLPVIYFCSLIAGLGLIAALLWAPTWPCAWTAVEWLLACFTAGNLGGFLFGIPKNSQSAAGTAATAAYKPVINNNLVEISDWLTKIIVGLGLVKLTKIPPYLQGLAAALAKGLIVKDAGLPAATAFAYGLIICYLIVGFLFGYLVMRLYLAGEMVAIDDKTYNGLKNNLNEMAAKIDTLDTGQAVLQQGLLQNNAAPVAGDKEANLTELRKMAVQYMNITPADYSERVRQKQEAAAAMAAFASNNGINKDDILALYATEADEGLLIVLATLIIMKPEAGDVDRLMRYANKTTRKHIEYRILNALGKLLETKIIKTSDKAAIAQLIATYHANGDAALIKKADAVTLLLNNYQGC